MKSVTEQLKVALADRYVIEKEIGEGGMATVYLAHDVKHDRKVALKVLRPELAAVIGAERFLQEIKVTANLQHAHILPLHDSGDADGFLYYVMPFVEGESLRDKLDREKQLAVDEAVKIAESVAAALDYAHRQDVVHRDIKPENILLHDGQALVADFGIALAISHAGASRLTDTGLSIGTPHYMSPEQAMGDRELDARSDVYSLGAMLYELLAGDPPYQGSTAQAVVAKVITEKAPPVTAARDTVPNHVAAAISKALAKLPADRFASAAEFASALTNPAYALAAEPMATGEVAATVARAPVLADRRFLVASGVAVLAVALAVWALTRPQPSPQVARFAITLAEGQEIASQAGTTIALSPDGSLLVYVGVDGRLWLRPIDQLLATPLAGTDGAFSPFFSSDGESVGFVTAGELKVVHVTGGPPLTITDSICIHASWGSDDQLYVLRPGCTELVRMPRGGGTSETVAIADSTSTLRWPHVLPGAEAALVTIWRGNLDVSDIAAVSFETGETKVLVRGAAGRYANTGHMVYTRGDGALLAIPFDVSSLGLTGSPTPLIEGVVVKGGGASEFTMSENGTLLFLSGRAASERLMWVARDGTEQLVDPQVEQNFEYVAISPDGERIALTMDSPGDPTDIWVYETGLRTMSRITFEGTVNFRPVWTPDGRAITFVSDRAGKREIYSKPWDGSGFVTLVQSADANIWEAEWSRDGETLVFRMGGDAADTRDLLYVRPDVDSTAQPFLVSEFDEQHPALSPDGRWLAYTSDESGRDEVYVRPFPGPGGRRQVSVEGGRMPLWAHSGDEIFFRSADNNLVAVEVRSDPSFALGTRNVLFSVQAYESDLSHRTYDVTADDQRFLFIQQFGGSQDIIVVLNWFEELRQRMGN